MSPSTSEESVTEVERGASSEAFAGRRRRAALGVYAPVDPAAFDCVGAVLELAIHPLEVGQAGAVDVLVQDPRRHQLRCAAGPAGLRHQATMRTPRAAVQPPLLEPMQGRDLVKFRKQLAEAGHEPRGVALREAARAQQDEPTVVLAGGGASCP